MKEPPFFFKAGNNPNSGRYSRDLKKARSSEKKKEEKKGGRDWTRTHVVPRGYEQEIGPAHQNRKARANQAALMTYDRGHRSYEHQDMDTKMNK
jgi:hypothetical protein